MKRRMSPTANSPSGVRSNGFSLVTVLSVGMIATLIVSALLASIAPVYRSVSGDRNRLQLKNFAEASCDYVIAKLNDPAFSESVAPGDEIGAQPVTMSVTSSELGIPGNLTSTVKISNELAPQTSRLFNPTLSPTGYGDDGTTFDQDWSYFTEKGMNKSWRTITAVVSSGSLTLELAVAAQIDVSYNRQGSGPNSFFNYAALGTQTIKLENEASTYGFKSGDVPIRDPSDKFNLGGDIAAYRQVQLDNSKNSVGGSMDVPSITPSVISTIQGSNTEVSRYVTVNDSAPAIQDSKVHGLGNPAEQIPIESRPSKLEDQSNPQPKLPPAPSLPTSTAYTAGGDLNLATGSPISGNYSASSLATTGLVNSSGASIFIRDTGISDQVVDIKGSINPAASKSSSDFQIWYNGKGKISVKATTVRATIYAPNAEVEIVSETAQKGAFKGAVVAKTLRISNVDFGFDKNMSASPSQKYDPSSLKIFTDPTYKVVSYKERTSFK